MRPSGRSPTPLAQHPGTFGGSLVEVGRIVGPHGVRGEVRLQPHNPNSATLTNVERITLRGGEPGLEQTHRVLAARRHGRFVLLRLEGVESVEQAEELVGWALCVRRDELSPPRAHEAYYIELLGSTVELDTGEALGVVREIFSTGSNDVLIVDSSEREYLVPFIADVIVRVDAARRLVVIHRIPGLLDP